MSWTSGSSYTITAGADFLFLVDNPFDDMPRLFECSNTAYAIYSGYNYGPTFGGGHDLTIHPSGQEGYGSCTSFPSSYTDTIGRGNSTFTGARDFSVEDFEVWAVT